MLDRELKAQGNFLFKTRSFWPVLLLALSLYLSFSSGVGSPWELYLVPSLCLSVCGMLIRFFTVGYAAPATSGRNTTAGQIADSLNTSGWYATCRHPLYFGNFLIWMGVALLSTSWWFVAVVILVFWLYYERIMYAEEAFLKEKFGEVFEKWAQQTPAFVPQFWRWKQPVNSFSWRKALLQEKSGMLNLMIVYYIFYCLNRMTLGLESLHFEIWDLLMLLMLVGYLILKVWLKLRRV